MLLLVLFALIIVLIIFIVKSFIEKTNKYIGTIVIYTFLTIGMLYSVSEYEYSKKPKISIKNVVIPVTNNTSYVKIIRYDSKLNPIDTLIQKIK